VPDEDILAAITELAAEEHRLERSAGESGLAADDLARLDDLNLRLDQCWDLLRQRRARRNAGLDPTDAEVRDPGVVEGYRQ
jgi:hypothetical protein